MNSEWQIHNALLCDNNLSLQSFNCFNCCGSTIFMDIFIWETTRESTFSIFIVFICTFNMGKSVTDWLQIEIHFHSSFLFINTFASRDVSDDDDDDHNMNLKIKKSCQWKLSDLAIQQSVKFNLAKIETVFLQLRLNLVLIFNWRVQKVYFNSGNTLCMPLIECQVE